MIKGCRKINQDICTQTYIGNDREFADSTQNVVPNPWRQHEQKYKKENEREWTYIWEDVMVKKKSFF